MASADNLTSVAAPAPDPAAPFVPFVRICSPLGGGSIFLGNDTIRAALRQESGSSLQALQKVGPQVTREAADLVQSFGIELHMPPQDMRSSTLANCKLLVSVNDMKEGVTCKVELDGLQHVYAPINENNVELYPRIFEALLQGSSDPDMEAFDGLFTRMDELLTQGMDVFVHCNQGEHRSAAVIVLYLCSRRHCDFESAHAYVLQHRPIIKPCTDRRPTLMTEFARLHKEAQNKPQRLAAKPVTVRTDEHAGDWKAAPVAEKDKEPDPTPSGLSPLIYIGGLVVVVTVFFLVLSKTKA